MSDIFHFIGIVGKCFEKCEDEKEIENLSNLMIEDIKLLMEYHKKCKREEKSK